MGIAEEIAEKEILVYLVPKEAYLNKKAEILSAISSAGAKTCYVTVDKPYSSIISEDVIRQHAQNFYFVDAVTNQVSAPPKTANCKFVSSPTALTELTIAISQTMLKYNCTFLFFDSLSAMMLYHQPSAILKMVHMIVSKIRINKAKSVFIALAEDINEELVKDLYMLADAVINLQ